MTKKTDTVSEIAQMTLANTLSKKNKVKSSTKNVCHVVTSNDDEVFEFYGTILYTPAKQLFFFFQFLCSRDCVSDKIASLNQCQAYIFKLFYRKKKALLPLFPISLCTCWYGEEMGNIIEQKKL